MALDLMISSISANTLRQYNVSFKLWWQFCQEQSLNVLNTSIKSVITFLTGQFYNGSSYGTINTHRSALSLLLGNHVGSDDRIKRLLKGIYKQKPCRPRYTTTWNPQVVLDYIYQWIQQHLSTCSMPVLIYPECSLCFTHYVCVTRTFLVISCELLSCLLLRTKQVTLLISVIIDLSPWLPSSQRFWIAY